MDSCSKFISDPAMRAILLSANVCRTVGRLERTLGGGGEGVAKRLVSADT
jgi:hypothetical protein